MSIISTDVPDIIPFNPSAVLTDPFPYGLWRATRSITGDGTGGYILYTVSPISAAEAAKYLWSVESYSLTKGTGLAAVNVVWACVTGERYVRTGGTETLMFARQGYAGVTANRQAATANGPSSVRDWPVHQPGNGLTNSYSMECENTNGVVHQFAIWGYVWNSEARRLAGGPRRPD